MENTTTATEFSKKFSKLSEQNQKYIVGIQEALLYAQDSDQTEKSKKEDDKK